MENTISFMYHVNKSGPNIDPCGTPVNISALSDKIMSDASLLSINYSRLPYF